MENENNIGGASPKPRFGALSSSVDPAKLSMTVTSAIVAIGGIVTVIASYMGYTILPDDIEQLAGFVGVVVGTVATTVSTVSGIFGLIRKVIARNAK